MSSSSQKRYEEAIQQVDVIIANCIDMELHYQDLINKVHPSHRASACNLIHYITYRNHISTSLKRFLFGKGLSGLKNAEAHIMASLQLTRKRLHQLAHDEVPPPIETAVTFKKAEKIAKRNSRQLLGNKSKKRNVRIMVTQPSEAANNSHLAAQMMRSGMNTVRINCAHDTETEWLQMIRHVRAGMDTMQKHVKITMDLGGPKVRTGAIQHGPKVAHLRPERDDFGRVIDPGKAALIAEGQLFPDEDNIYIPIPSTALRNLLLGEDLSFQDTRGKKRLLRITEIEGKVIWVHGYESAYIQTGTEMTSSQSNQTFAVGEIPPLEQYLLLKKGDHLTLHKEQTPGEPAKYDRDGNLLQKAHISCTAAEVFEDVKAGERIIFDDGKIIGYIHENTGDELEIKITHAKDLGTKLKMDKGINFPVSRLHISGLTDKDKEDLKFVTKHADVINMSFVNTTADVEQLISELDLLGAKSHIGVVLKIETMTAVKNIVKLLLSAMQLEKVGVMIARGDLAIECGWQNVGLVQEELLKICRSAHIPTIWATQVMENLAKKGVPSRAEITDAVMAQKADCIMLNKGMYILEAIQLLDTILINTEKAHWDKKQFFKEMAY